MEARPGPSSAFLIFVFALISQQSYYTNKLENTYSYLDKVSAVVVRVAGSTSVQAPAQPHKQAPAAEQAAEPIPPA